MKAFFLGLLKFIAYASGAFTFLMTFACLEIIWTNTISQAVYLLWYIHFLAQFSTLTQLAILFASPFVGAFITGMILGLIGVVIVEIFWKKLVGLFHGH